MLTDEQCNEFRRLPGSFNNMVREIYKSGMLHAAKMLGDTDNCHISRCEKNEDCVKCLAAAISKEAGE